MGGLQKEDIYFEPVETQVNFGFLLSSYQTNPGDLMTLYWIDYQVAKDWVKNLAPISVTPDDFDWKEPMFGT
jgi:hypothetical protein